MNCMRFFWHAELMLCVRLAGMTLWWVHVSPSPTRMWLAVSAIRGAQWFNTAACGATIADVILLLHDAVLATGTG